MMLRSKCVPAVVFCILATCCNTLAQQYKVKAMMKPVSSTGFYAIAITPPITAYAKADLSDIRIQDSAKGTFVPYIVRKRSPALQDKYFTEFPVYSNIVDSNYSIIEMQNPLANGISDISLVLHNTAVERYTMVSGSDDKNKWYIIDDRILFHRSYNNSNGTYLQTINFPVSRYHYFRLKIYNEHTDPLHIVKAGHYSNTAPALPEFEDVPAPAMEQKDSSNGISYITLHNTEPYLTNQVALNISGPKFYQRSAVLYIQAEKYDSTGLDHPVVQFTITSGTEHIVEVPAQKAYTIKIEIDNKDNPPLTITGATTRQEKQQLVAWLEKEKAYLLLAGNAAVAAPQYDLSQFRDSIPAVLPTVSLTALTPVPEQAQVKRPSGNSWLWPSIIVAVLLLGALTYRLITDVKRNGNPAP